MSLYNLASGELKKENNELKQEIKRLKGALQTHEILLQSNTKEIERLNKELESLEKLNNVNYQSFIETNKILIELERYINKTKLEEFEKEYGRRYGKTFTQAEVIVCNMILAKLKELKGVDKK